MITLRDMIWNDVMSISCDITTPNDPQWAGMNFRENPLWNNLLTFMNALSDISFIDVMWILCGIAPSNDWIHNEQLRISGKNALEFYWHIFINTLPGMFCFDIMSTVCSIAPQNVWTHIEQVWVSGYKLHWNNQMTPKCLLINRPPDIMCIDVMWTYVSLPL